MIVTTNNYAAAVCVVGMIADRSEAPRFTGLENFWTLHSTPDRNTHQFETSPAEGILESFGSFYTESVTVTILITPSPSVTTSSVHQTQPMVGTASVKVRSKDLTQWKAVLPSMVRM
jgi:hypothetical protein